MMDFLGFNVASRGLNEALADTEGGITGLPSEWLAELFIHPSGGISLKVPDEIGKGEHGGKRRKNMHVILHAIDDQRDGADSMEDTAHIGHEARFELSGNHRLAVFGGEYDVDVDGIKCVCHGDAFFRRYRGSQVTMPGNPRPRLRACRGLLSCRRYRGWLSLGRGWASLGLLHGLHELIDDLFHAHAFSFGFVVDEDAVAEDGVDEGFDVLGVHMGAAGEEGAGFGA